MTNEQLFEEIKALNDSMRKVELGMEKLSSDFQNHKDRNDERITMILKALEDAKEGRAVLHKKQDVFDDRLKTVEGSPVFKDWESIKKNLSSWFWKGFGILAVFFLVKSLPDIINFIGERL